MKKLSDGTDSTLKRYREYASILFGDDSQAVRFLDNKMKESPNGENEEVLADERQMIHMLANIK